MSFDKQLLLSVESIFKKIRGFLGEDSSLYSNWYVCTERYENRLKKRLFDEHRVHKNRPDGYGWFFVHCTEVAQKVREKLVSIGCDSCDNQEDEEAKYIYVYRKTSGTKP